MRSFLRFGFYFKKYPLGTSVAFAKYFLLQSKMAERASKKRKFNDEETARVDEDKTDTTTIGVKTTVPTSIIVQLQTMEVRANALKHTHSDCSEKSFVCRESTLGRKWTSQ